MSVKLYVTIMLIATLLSWASWLLIIFMVAPGEAGELGFVFFYASLFLGLLGTASLTGLLIRHIKARQRFVVEKAIISFRQGIWLALLVIGALILQSQGLLTWWNTIFLLLIVAFLEFFFMSAHTNREHRKYI